RLLLLSPVSQINPKRWGRKAKTGLGIRITAGTPDRSNSTQLGVLNLHSVQFQIIEDGVHAQIQTQIAKKPRFLPKCDSPHIGMKPVSADHAIELAHTILCELNLCAVCRLVDSLNGIVKQQLDVPEMVPQDLTQCAANDLDISASAMPKVIPAHTINDFAFFVDEYGPLHIGMRRNNGVMNPHLPENLQCRPAHIDLIAADQQRRCPLHDGRTIPVAPQPIGGSESCGSGA